MNKSRQQQICNELSHWIDIAYANRENFIMKFCKGAFLFDQISWDNERMYITYVDGTGQHLYKSIPIKKWFSFIAKYL